jgi:hypothetical protein
LGSKTLRLTKRLAFEKEGAGGKKGNQIAPVMPPDISSLRYDRDLHGGVENLVVLGYQVNNSNIMDMSNQAMVVEDDNENLDQILEEVEERFQENYPLRKIGRDQTMDREKFETIQKDKNCDARIGDENL